MRAIGASGTPVKHLAREVKDLNLSLEERNLLSLSYGRIIRKDIESNEGLLPANFERYTVVRPGDVVLRLTDLQNDQRSLRTGLVKEPGIITSAYLTLRPQSTVDSRYFAYALHAVDVAQVFYTLGGGLRQSMGMEEVGGLRLALPQLEEQRRIADFLDDQLRTIDAIIDLRGKQLQALREGALHAHADAALHLWGHVKQPLIPWFPVSRDGWRLYRVSWIAQCLDAKRVPLSGTEREARQGPYPYYGASTVVDHIDAFIFDEPLVLVGEDGGALTNPAFDVVQEVSGKTWVNNHAHVLRATAVEPAFLAGILRCVDRPLLLSGSTRPKITQDDLMSLRVPVGPASDREVLLRSAETIRSMAAAQRSVLESATDRLQEYKRSLVSAAVTGELDVTTARRGIPA